MTVITDENFLKWAPELRGALLRSDFVAIDFEFFGLDTSGMSLHDTTESRYRVLRETVTKYPPCQLGLSIFKQNPQGSYMADSYSIPLIRRVGSRDTQTNSQSIRFLLDHGFDLKQVFNDGVGYCTRDEYRKFKTALEGGTALSFFDTVLSEHIQCLKVMVHEKAYQKLMFNTTHNTEERLPPESPSLQPGTTVTLKIQKSIMSKSSLEMAIVVHELTKAFPKFQFVPNVEKSSLTVSNLSNKRLEQENVEHTKNVCAETFEGVAAILEATMMMRKVIVGHNSLLDCMYLYHYFFRPLPEKYEVFKRKFHELYPKVMDTKILAQMLRMELTGVGDSLERLGNFLNTDKADAMIPPELRGTIKNWLITEPEPSKKYHDAAYDAFITGSIFLKLSHVFINRRNGLKNEVIKFVRMLQFLSTPLENRLPFQLLDVGCCNLAGEDSEGYRPDVITVVRRDRRPIGESEYEVQEKDLYRQMATYKFSVQLTKNKMAMLLATNTPSSYAFLCDQYSKNKTFSPLDELESGIKLTFEQRQTSWRCYKEEMNAVNNMITRNWARGEVARMEEALVN